MAVLSFLLLAQGNIVILFSLSVQCLATSFDVTGVQLTKSLIHYSTHVMEAIVTAKTIFFYSATAKQQIYPYCKHGH